MGMAMEKLIGPGAGPKELERMECMQREGRRVYKEHMSYWRNPVGVTERCVYGCVYVCM